MNDSVVVGSDGGILVSGLLVQGVDDLISQIGEGFSDVGDGSLVREVLVGGQSNEGGDDGGEDRVVLEVAVDLLEVGLDSLDLDERRVAELGEESKALIDGGQSLVVLGDFRFEDSVFSFPDASFVSEGLSVLVNVGSQLSQGVGQSVSGGEEDVVNHVVAVEDVSVSVFQLLGESGNIGIVVVGPAVELVDQFVEFGFQITNELLDGLN